MNAQRSEQSGLSRRDTGSTLSDAMPSVGVPTVSDTGAQKTPQDQLTPAKTHVDDFPSLNSCLGDYQLIAEVARGGMGIVFKAQDTSGNLVALKTIRRDRISGSEFVQRFAREVQAAQQLKHPNVMPILDVGEADGFPFFTMEFVPQGSLSQHRARFFQGDPRATVRLMEQVARGVQHAHDHGVLHRDLKPGNILLGEGDIPRVSDFGLAKIVGSDGELTRTGQLLGTTPYMAPEQATGRIHEIGPCSDVWALGVILYELLAGRRPFIADDDVVLIRQIQTEAPSRPSKLRPEIAAELDAIVLKCLQKKAEDRYNSAQELADDLARWLAGRSVTLGRPSLPRRMTRGVKRHPWLVATCLVMVAAMITAAIVLPRLDLAAMFATVPVVPRPTPEARADPELVRRELEAKLARGEAVVWIAEKGLPVSSRWIVGANEGTSRLSADGFFTLDSLSFGLHELTPDPQAERFTLRGWVRQNDNTEDGMVGFYFGYRQFAMGNKNNHGFYSLGYAEDNVRARMVRLDLTRLVETPEESVDLATANVIKRDLPINPSGLGTWREFVIEVSAERIRVHTGDLLIGDAEKKTLGLARKNFMKGLAKVEPSPVFGPRQSLGLFVYRGSASFKSVKIMPLPALTP